MEINKIYNGDCLEVLKEFPDNSIDAIITDPPYGISFMGKKWDYDVPSIPIWEECLRVLKPGGYLLAFAGTRTQHRMAVRIEDAGFEIRDMIAWVYGSGFPKSFNIAKAIEAEEKYGKSGTRTLRQIEQDGDGETYELKGTNNGILGESRVYSRKRYSPQGIAAKWDGWGTALKPALEPITLARKPISEKSIAENVLKWGTGGINIDGCRVGFSKKEPDKREQSKYTASLSAIDNMSMYKQGRFPANLIHDGSDEVVELFPETTSGYMSSELHNRTSTESPNGIYGKYNVPETFETFGDSGSAARFFYCAKVSPSERGDNKHPTVKPLMLMEYLVKLVTRDNYIVLDPFAGSGSTIIACKNLNRNYIGIELDKEYVQIINKRLSKFNKIDKLF